MRLAPTSSRISAVALVLVCGCKTNEPPRTPPAATAAPASTAAPLALPDDGMVDVGNGTSLHVRCDGEGSPLVVLDECSGCDATSWHAIQPQVAGFTRVCAYDRAGVGYSTPAPRPHLERQLLRELRALLGNRDDAGPIVLVGQGSGGFLAQVYARDFPHSVVGMVLVDTATKDYDTRYYAMFPPEALARLKQDGPGPPEYLDVDDQARAMADMRGSPLSLGGRPLVAINHGKPWTHPLFGTSADDWAKLETVWFGMEADVALLSTNSSHVVATEAEWIPEEAPGRVVTAVWNVVSSARTGVPLNRLPATAPPAPASTTSPTAHTPRGPVDDGLVDIGGGMSLHIHCIGRGTPTVVFDNGHGARGASWGKVLNEIGAVTRTCVYDRAGIGYSSHPAPRPHPLRQMANELQTLLERAGVAGPYVLVAHSMAGLNDRLFQAEHPDEVVGMVLVDVTAETVPPPSGDAEKARERWRDDAEGVDYDTFQAGLADVRASGRSLGDMPLVVLSAAGKGPPPPDLSPEQVAEMSRRYLAAHEQMAHLSTNSAHLVADRSGHFIQLDAPLLVIASVKQVVEAVRTHGRVDPKVLAPFAHDGPAEPVP
jgi:pimeloyl-ACP methyl ester carboxylesterase